MSARETQPPQIAQILDDEDDLEELEHEENVIDQLHQIRMTQKAVVPVALIQDTVIDLEDDQIEL